MRDHLHAGMLEDFRATAWLQASAGHVEGLNSLFAFYSYGLEKNFRSSVYQLFEQDALKVPAIPEALIVGMDPPPPLISYSSPCMPMLPGCTLQLLFSAVSSNFL